MKLQIAATSYQTHEFIHTTILTLDFPDCLRDNPRCFVSRAANLTPTGFISLNMLLVAVIGLLLNSRL